MGAGLPAPPSLHPPPLPPPPGCAGHPWDRHTDSSNPNLDFPLSGCSCWQGTPPGAAEMFENTGMPALPAQDHSGQSRTSSSLSSWLGGALQMCTTAGSAAPLPGQSLTRPCFPLSHPSGFPLVWATLLILLMPGGPCSQCWPCPSPKFGCEQPELRCKAGALLGWSEWKQDLHCPLIGTQSFHPRARDPPMAPRTLCYLFGQSF